MLNISDQTGRNLSDNNNKPGLEEETVLRETAASQEEIKFNPGETIERDHSGDH